jgi:Mrp family chromosome partitioning ATPase/DUF971 family protein
MTSRSFENRVSLCRFLNENAEKHLSPKMNVVEDRSIIYRIPAMTMMRRRTILMRPAATTLLVIILYWKVDHHQSFGFLLRSRTIHPRWPTPPPTTTTTTTTSATTRPLFFHSLSSSSSSLFSSKNDVATTSTSSTTITASKIPTEWQGQVLAALKNVIDPDLGADIVSLGFVQNLKLDTSDNDDDDDDDDDIVVSFDVQLTTPACPVKEQFKLDCERLVMTTMPWKPTRVDVTMTAQQSRRETDTVGMQQIGSIIAVSSCKGGVGKSTTAVNLAFALQKLGATVGILDADIYGPSLPTMVTPDDDVVRFVGRQIAPLQRNGVRLMSFGYVNEAGTAAVMRGPMITQLLDQFLSVISWGALDYLILDMPPGTGDIQLTLTQRLNISAAVIVTTPQELSFVDVARGVDMFDSVNVPCIAVVENMAYYEVEKPSLPSKQQSAAAAAAALDRAALKLAFFEKLESIDEDGDGLTMEDLSDELVDIVMNQVEQQAAAKVDQESSSSTTTTTTERVQIFGPGHKKRLSEQWGIEHTFSIPLLDRIAANGDAGTPFILEHADSAPAAIFMDLAKSVVSEVAKAKFAAAGGRPSIIYDQKRHVIQVSNINAGTGNVNKKNDDDGDDSQSSFLMKPADLRRACRCAMCVEELTGRQILVPSSIPETVKPLRMGPTGNYALSVDWSDGHRSLYPYRQIASLVQEEQQQLKSSKTAASKEKKEARSNQVPV